MGSAAGAVLGGAYLTAAGAHRAAPAAAVAARVTPDPSPSVAAAGSAPGALTRPATASGGAAPVVAPAVVAAKPFRFADVARGSTDLQCLTEAVYFEARGEPEQGQKAVAQVILNRVRHPAFPKTICGVVHQRTDAGCQFSFACAPQPRGHDGAAWTRAEAVAHGALHGAVMRQIGDATHFESVRAAAFAGLLKVARIGEHVFYRFGGRSGAAGMFRQTPAPSAAPGLLLASAAASPVAPLAALHTPPAPLAAAAASATTSAVAAKVVPAKVPAFATVTLPIPAPKLATVVPPANLTAVLVSASTATTPAPRPAKPTATAAAVAS